MIASWAAPYIGIPYQSNGRTRVGCDCWGLIVLVYREVFGITLPSYDVEYVQAGDGAVVEQLLRTHIPELPWQPLTLAEAKPGDALVFALAGHPVHCGLFVGDGFFLHVLSRLTASCLERLRSAGWARRLVGIYRYV